MSAITQQAIEAHADRVVQPFADGFQIHDLAEIVPQVMEIVGAVDGMSGADKKATAVAIIGMVIDRVDLPWIPDSLIDPLLKRLVPSLIEMAWDSYAGRWDFTVSYPPAPTE